MDNGFEDIAVIGLSGKFPGAGSISEFWDNIRKGKESISFFTDEELLKENIDSKILNQKNYVKAKGVLESAGYFDYKFFDFTLGEAEAMDPQFQAALECSWEALESAGIPVNNHPKNIGVFISASSSTISEVINFSLGNNDWASMQLSNKDFLATLISYKLNLTGPSFNIHSSCSSSLNAIHQACKSILFNECEAAIAGGVSITRRFKSGYLYQEGMVLSPDGHCKVFDEGANGTVVGNGVGIVVLKKLEQAINDRDNILAVIKGSCINNDGKQKVGYTAPSAKGQSEVIREAISLAKIFPHEVSYIEAHGTGTLLGDPIEVNALKSVFGNSKEKHCCLGSVKANIGHLDAAAGVAGFIKTVLILYNREIPPQINVQNENKKINIEDTPFYINKNTYLKYEEGNKFIAGVSSFGIGGTNIHIVLEEFPKRKNFLDQKWNILTLSAKSEKALTQITDNFKSFLKEYNGSFSDIAYTLNVGRNNFQYRKGIVCKNISEALQKLEGETIQGITENGTTINKVFMFSGQGSQYAGMGETLYNDFPIFKKFSENGLQYLYEQFGVDIRDIFINSGNLSDEYLSQTQIVQPFLFIYEYSLAQTLIELGIKPTCMIGHSLGEYVAACLADVFSFEDGIKIIYHRSNLMKQIEKGTMISVMLNESELAGYLSEVSLSIAAVNFPGNTVISGEGQEIDKFLDMLNADEIFYKKLTTSHAFHSSMMDQMLDEFQQILESINLHKPRIPFISNLTGNWIRNSEAMSSQYWRSHVRECVKFSKGINTLSELGSNVYIEVGPGNTLSYFVKQNISDLDEQVVNLQPHQKEDVNADIHFLEKLIALWCMGIDINLEELYDENTRYKVNLPTYPFNKHHFTEKNDILKKLQSLEKGLKKNDEKVEGNIPKCYLPSWIKSINRNIDTKKTLENWLIIYDDKKLAQHFSQALKDEKLVFDLLPISSSNNVNVIPGLDEKLHDYSKSDLTINIVLTWLMNGKADLEILERYENITKYYYFKLVHLISVIVKLKLTNKINIKLVTSSLFNIADSDETDPLKSIIVGLGNSIPLEYDGINFFTIEMNAESFQEPQMVKKLAKELKTATHEPTIALRKKNRWSPSFSLMNGIHHQNKFKQNGNYVIIGGYRGISKTITDELIAKYSANVAVAGRTNVSESVLKIADNKKGKDLAGLQEEKIKYFQTDVTKNGNLVETFKRINQFFKKIDGIFYVAGMPDDVNLVHTKSRARVNEVMDVKVKGIIELENALNGIEYDWIVLFSALSSIVGTVGQSAYTAANCFLDSYAQSEAFKSSKVISINWDTWTETGMAFNAIRNEGFGDQECVNMLKYGLKNQEGFTFLQYAVTCNQPQILITKQKIDSLLQRNKPYRSDIEGRKSFNMKNVAAQENFKPQEELSANDIQREILNIWKEFFSNSELSSQDSFFDIGGDSIRALRLINLIHEKTGIKIPFKQFFKFPTVKGIIENLPETNNNAFIKIKQVEKKQYYPLSSAQQRLFFMWEMDKRNLSYNLPVAIHIIGDLDLEFFKTCIEKAFNRHECLKYSFQLIDGTPCQRVNNNRTFNVGHEDIGKGDVDCKFKEFVRPFDLLNDLLVRVKLLSIHSGSHILFLDIHHIISDQVSQQLFLSDIEKFYNHIQPRELHLHYKDYADYSHKILKKEDSFKKELNFWLNHFSGTLPNVKIPYDMDFISKENPVNGTSFIKKLDRKLVNQVSEYIKEEEVTLFIFMEAVYNILLSKYTQLTDIIIGTPANVREDSTLKNVMGVFVNMLVLRNKPEGHKSFNQFLNEVRENTVNTFDNQGLPFDKLISNLKLNRNLSGNVLFNQVLTVSDNAYNTDYKSKSNLIFKPYDSKIRMIPYDLIFQISKRNDELEVEIGYDSNKYFQETIEMMHQRFTEILETIVANREITLDEIILNPCRIESEQRIQIGTQNDFDFDF